MRRGRSWGARQDTWAAEVEAGAAEEEEEEEEEAEGEAVTDWQQTHVQHTAQLTSEFPGVFHELNSSRGLKM